MAVDAETPRTHRAVLAAAIGAAAATVALALGRPLPAIAADGGPVVIGSTNDGTNTTIVRNLAATALGAISTTGVGLCARSHDLAGGRRKASKVRDSHRPVPRGTGL